MITKADFIRKHPDLTTRKLIEVAAREGVQLTKSRITGQRSRDRKRKPVAQKTPKIFLASSLMPLVYQYGTAGLREMLDCIERAVLA